MNDYIVYDNCAEIILRDKNGIETGKAIIDIEDIEKCKTLTWHIKRYKNREYCNGKINRKNIRLHRFLLDYFKQEFEIDHIDGNGLNNRKNNLRKVTHQQNMMNQRVLPKNNTSGYIGIYFDNKLKKYISQIKVNQKKIHIGVFSDIKDAILARREAELKYFSKYKSINFEEKICK